MPVNGVRVVNSPAYRKWIKAQDLGKPSAVVVGIRGAAATQSKVDHDHQTSGQTVAEVAWQHEFGIGVPQRSWLRDWFDNNRDQINKDLEKLMQSVILGKVTKEQGLNLLGLRYVGQIQKRISHENPFEPNAPSTIALKGSSTPLIDTGQMRSAITYELERMAS